MSFCRELRLDLPIYIQGPNIAVTCSGESPIYHAPKLYSRREDPIMARRVFQYLGLLVE